MTYPQLSYLYVPNESVIRQISVNPKEKMENKRKSSYKVCFNIFVKEYVYTFLKKHI